MCRLDYPSWAAGGALLFSVPYGGTQGVARPKSDREMSAEFLREVAVLTMVFFPLDSRHRGLWWYLAIAAGSLVLLILGMGLENSRREEPE